MFKLNDDLNIHPNAEMCSNCNIQHLLQGEKSYTHAMYGAHIHMRIDTNKRSWNKQIQKKKNRHHASVSSKRCCVHVFPLLYKKVL